MPIELAALLRCSQNNSLRTASELVQKSNLTDNRASYKSITVIQKRYNARMTTKAPTSERWLTKRQVAEHFGFTTRWVELRMREGMPSMRFGSRRRFRLSDVEAWLFSRS